MNVLLGIGGGIAAYKSAELARLLQERGHAVQAVLTAGAQQFLSPLTLAALTGRKAITMLFDASSPEATLSSAVEHIGVARESDALVVAPATADLLARLAHGLADDFLTTAYLAFTGPVILAPAMNTHMWNHAATRHNVALLRERGHELVGPEEGLLACGTSGPGRLAGIGAIADAVDRALSPRRDWEGDTLLLTAGPTREALDPVRFISNRSSGKMGYAIAEAAQARGARVILVSGPVALPGPRGVDVVRVTTAREMRQAVLDQLASATVIVKAAAVADYHVRDVPQHKIKKAALRLSLELDPTPDILAEVGEKKGDRLLVGFAAETDNLVEEARRKMASKRCDMVVANLVGPEAEGVGFESDQNEVTVVMRTGEVIRLARAPKREIADAILDQALRLRLALHAAMP